MPKKLFTAEEIIHQLREAEVLAAQGRSVDYLARQLGATVVQISPVKSRPSSDFVLDLMQ